MCSFVAELLVVAYPLQFFAKKSNISKVMTKYNVGLQVFPLNGLKRISVKFRKISPKKVYENYVAMYAFVCLRLFAGKNCC